jgi:hypothetical protein
VKEGVHAGEYRSAKFIEKEWRQCGDPGEQSIDVLALQGFKIINVDI